MRRVEGCGCAALARITQLNTQHREEAGAFKSSNIQTLTVYGISQLRN